MNTAHLIQGDIMRRNLAEMLPDFALHYFEPAFAEGSTDPEPAAMLMVTAPNEFRGFIAVAMYLSAVEPAVFRAALASAWEHDHGYVIEAARYRKRLEAMFRRAAFPLPDHLPETLTVWRGTSGLPLAKASKGYSWTSNRDVAAWFAMRYADLTGAPLLLRREIRRDDILLWSDARNESEAVVFRSAPAVVDGDTVDWEIARKRQAVAIRASNKATIEALAARRPSAAP